MNEIFVMTLILICVTIFAWLYLNGKENIEEISKFQFQQKLNTINDI